jgi:hypothetical protein
MSSKLNLMFGTTITLSVAFIVFSLSKTVYATTRQRWEFGRFLKTAAYYDALLPKIPFFSSTKKRDSLVLKPGEVIWNRTGAHSTTVEWGPLDDVVMGNCKILNI